MGLSDKFCLQKRPKFQSENHVQCGWGLPTLQSNVWQLVKVNESEIYVYRNGLMILFDDLETLIIILFLFNATFHCL